MLGRRSSFAGLLALVPGAARAAPPNGALYIDGGANPVGIVLVPGRGQSPDGYVVGPMRKALNAAAGYHTCAVALPATTQVEQVTPQQAFQELKALYPAAQQSILAAASFLRAEHGVKRVYLLAHSMGTTISAAMLAESGGAGFAGVILVATGDYLVAPFATTANVGRITIPVLDVYSDPEGISNATDARLAAGDVKLAAGRASYESPRYHQVHIPAAGHAFVRSEKQAVLAKTIADWISAQESVKR